MPKVISPHFGAIQFTPGDQFVFPGGLPGFPFETAFVPIEIPEQFPLLYLQSLRTPDLCFVTLPVNSIVANYKFAPDDGDLASIGLGPYAEPGSDMLCLALLCFGEDGTATANLRAPIVVNVKDRVASQMIQSDDHYPFRFELKPAREVAVC